MTRAQRLRWALLHDAGLFVVGGGPLLVNLPRVTLGMGVVLAAGAISTAAVGSYVETVRPSSAFVGFDRTSLEDWYGLSSRQSVAIGLVVVVLLGVSAVAFVQAPRETSLLGLTAIAGIGTGLLAVRVVHGVIHELPDSHPADEIAAN